MTVNLSTLTMIAAISMGTAAVAPFTPAWAESSVLKISASPMAEELVRSISNAAAIGPVETSELNSIPALEQMCKGAGETIPSVVVSVSQITPAISDMCASNGIDALFEASLGYVTLVLVQKSSDPEMKLSSKALYKALAAQVPDDESFHPNTARTWSEADSTLAVLDILLIIAPRPGRSRAVFENEVMVGGCRQFKVAQNIFDASSRVATCTEFKVGSFLEVDDIDPRVQALREAAPGAIAVLPINVALKNKEWMRIIPFDGFMPTPENINAEDYNLTAPVYVYARPEDLNKDGSVRNWMNEALSEEAIGDKGYGKDLGLIELPLSMRDLQRNSLIK